MRITWAQVLGWRLARHGLHGAEARSVADVVASLGAVPAWSGDPEIAIGMRRSGHTPGDVDAAASAGELIRVFAFGGGTFWMTPEDAGTYLSLRGASRMWEQPSWHEHYGIAPEDWPSFRAAVREALESGPMTHSALAAAVGAAHPGFAPAFAPLSWTLLKPLCWQGDLCFGPDVEGEATFVVPASNPRWRGVPDPEDAGPRAVLAYLAAYGPATPAHLHAYLGEGLGAGKRRIDRWLTELSDRADAVARIDVGGDSLLARREDLDELATAEPADGLHLVAAHDPWVRGPGTKDVRIVPPELRSMVTRGANLVLHDGVVAGSWKAPRRGDDLVVTWRGPGGARHHAELEEPARRLADVLGRPLRLSPADR